jgi:two-component system cell cycle sensor histidine kinase/response regulator CckA
MSEPGARLPDADNQAVVNARLRALIDAGLELSFERDPVRLLHRACTSVCELFAASYVTLGILESDGRTVRHCFSCAPGGACAVPAGDWLTAGEVISGLLESIVDGRRVIRGVNAGGSPAALQLPPRHPQIHAYLGVPIASGHDVYGWICVINNDGASFVEDDEYFVVNLAGQVGRIYGLAHEILERQDGLMALRHERDRARGYLDAADVMLVAIDLAGRVTQINRKGCETLERDEWELLGRDWVETCLPARLRDGMRAALVNAFAGGLAAGENPVLTKSGAERIIEWRNTVLRDDAGQVSGIFSSGADVTERRTLEEQYLQAQKMEAVGRLAGGVAHDFNNLLTVILGYCEVLCGDLAADDPHLEDVKEIQRAGTSAAGLTRQLLAFSRKEMIQPTLFDLNVVAGDMWVMLQRVIGEDVHLALRLVAGPAPVIADRGQVEQVVMNLAVNARDAMPGGGTLTLATSVVEIDAAFARSHPGIAPGPGVVLSLTDTGTGMTPEVQARVFEPFFTTKAAGRGTGLGLPTVHAILSRSGGVLTIDSRVGHGTTVSAYFPRAIATENSATAPEPLARRIGNPTVLIVEDADEVRELASKQLQRRGYVVLEARNADEAVRVFDGDTAVDVILSDVVMPGTSGPEMMAQLLARRPGLKVVYMSGYTEDAIVSRGVLEPGVVFLHKPFTAESLERKLREALDRAVTP